MSESVGKVSLDLEVQSDLGRQIDEVAKNLGAGMKKAIGKATGLDFSGLEKSIDRAMKNMEKSVDTTMSNMNSSIDKMGINLETVLERALKRFTDVKNPFPDVREAPEARPVSVPSGQPRAPPMVKMPIVKVDLSVEMLEQQMEQIDRITRNVGDQIEFQEEKLKGLRESYKNTFNEATKNKLQEQIIKTEGTVTSLIGKMEQLGFQYDAIENKAKELSVANETTAEVEVPQVNTEPIISPMKAVDDAVLETKNNTQEAIQEVSQYVNLMNLTPGKIAIDGLTTAAGGLLKKVGSSAKSVLNGFFNTIKNGANKVGQAGSKLIQFAKGMKNTKNSSTEASSSFQRMLSTILRYRIIIPGIMKLIRGMASSLMASLKTNDQFSSSLKQMKSNLSVAFTPILQAIMPALNTLMAALARVTGYIAAFMSMLFGKTISGSVQATKSLTAAKSAMGAYGGSAKKAAKDAQGVSTGIDELNILNAENDDSGGGGGGGPEIVAPEIDTSQMGVIETAAQKVRDVLSQIFAPLKAAWDQEGQKVIDAAQYAFSNVLGLAEAVGKSFMEVWTNGTGELVCSNILQLVTLVFNMVGDIAGAFQRAWEEGGRGTDFIQSIFDRLNSWLELVHTIGESLRDVWNGGFGESAIGHVLDTFTNINDTITNIGDNFRTAWELDGVGTAIILDLADILDGLLESVDNITKSLSKWSKGLDFTPLLNAFKRISEALKPLGDKVGAGLEWLFENVLQPLAKWALEQGIPVVIEAIAGVFDLLNARLDAMRPTGEWLWENMLKPLATWTGGAIIDIIKGITSVFKGLTNIFTEISNGTDWLTIGQMLWEGLIEGITSFGSWAWGKVKEIFWGVVDTVKTLFGIHSPSTVFTEIGGFLIEGFLNGIIAAWGFLMEAVSGLIEPLIKLFETFMQKVSDGITFLWDNMLKPFVSWFTDTMGPIIATAIQGVIKTFQNFWSGVSEVIGYALDALGGLIDFIAGVFTGDWKRAWEGIKTFLSNIWEAMKSLVSTLFNAIKNIISTVLNTINSVWTVIWETIKAFASKLWESIKSKATEIFESIRDKLSEIWESVKKTIEEKWNAIKEWFDGIWQKIKDVFKLDEMIQIGADMMNNFWDGLKGVWEDITKWLSGIGEAVGKTFSVIVDGVTGIFKSGKEEAEESVSDSSSSSPSGGKDPGYVSTGPGIKGHATGGFPKSGSMFVANENGNPEMIGNWGGKAAVANNMQITEGISRAVQSGMRSCLAPVMSGIGSILNNAAPPLAMVGSSGRETSQESQLMDMISQAAAMKPGAENMSDQHLSIMVDLLKKIIELIENLDLTVNIDIREIKRKLVELEKRSGYTMRTT